MAGEFLGGDFGPERKDLELPSPQNPHRHPPGSSPPPSPLLGNPPPSPGIFNNNPTPRASWRLGLPLPLPRGERNEKYQKRPPRFTLNVAIGVVIYRMGILADAKTPGKWERKWKMAPGPRWPKKWPDEMEKWTPEWDSGHLFPFRRPLFGHFGPGAIFHFVSHFPKIFASARIPIL